MLQAQELTGVAVPKYYNPAAVNPLKYAEQVQKRKLLWSKSKEKKEGETATTQVRLLFCFVVVFLFQKQLRKVGFSVVHLKRTS